MSLKEGDAVASIARLESRNGSGSAKTPKADKSEAPIAEKKTQAPKAEEGTETVVDEKETAALPETPQTGSARKSNGKK